MFIDTLGEQDAYRRFNENFGSYPVLRVHDLEGQDIAGRIDGNLVAGRIPVDEVIRQLDGARR